MNLTTVSSSLIGIALLLIPQFVCSFDLMKFFNLSPG